MRNASPRCDSRQTGALSAAFIAAFGTSLVLITSRAAAAPPAASLLLDTNPGAPAGLLGRGVLTRVGSTLFFGAVTPATGAEPWRTNGTVAGTFLLADTRAGTVNGSPSEFTGHAGATYFRQAGTQGGSGLWRTDGTAAGTKLVLNPSAGNEVHALASTSKGLFFLAGGGIWKSDGTAASTAMVTTKAEGSPLVETSSTIFFPGFGFVPQSGRELWKTDGTDVGTVLVKDIEPGATASTPDGLQAIGARVSFAARTTASGREPWVSDGTAAGTVMLRDIRLGSGSSSPAAMCALPTQAFFIADDGSTTGSELWTTDGTAGGTHLVKDLSPGSVSTFSTPPSATACVSLGSKIVFLTFNSSTTAGGIYETDGTEAGTKLLFRPAAGKYSYNLVPTTDGRWLALVGTSPTTRTEFWISDAAASGGATLVGDVEGDVYSPGVLSDAVVFSHDDTTHGLEPWILPLPVQKPGGDGGPPPPAKDAGEPSDPTTDEAAGTSDSGSAVDADSTSTTTTGCGCVAARPIGSTFGAVALAAFISVCVGRRRRTRA